MQSSARTRCHLGRGRSLRAGRGAAPLAAVTSQRAPADPLTSSHAVAVALEDGHVLAHIRVHLVPPAEVLLHIELCRDPVPRGGRVTAVVWVPDAGSSNQHAAQRNGPLTRDRRDADTHCVVRATQTVTESMGACQCRGKAQQDGDAFHAEAGESAESSAGLASRKGGGRATLSSGWAHVKLKFGSPVQNASCSPPRGVSGCVEGGS